MLAGLGIAGVIIPHTAHERAELRRSRRHGAGRDDGGRAADGGGKGKAKGRGKKIERKEERNPLRGFPGCSAYSSTRGRAACFKICLLSLCLASRILCAGSFAEHPFPPALARKRGYESMQINYTNQAEVAEECGKARP